MNDLGVTLAEVRDHYKRRGLVFELFELLDLPAYSAVLEGLRIVLEGENGLTYAAMSSENIPDEMNELAELIAVDWDSAGFVPDETVSLHAEHRRICIRYIRVEEIERCLFTIHPC